MARNRQRAKQRQAERRAKRLAEQGGAGGAAPPKRQAEPRVAGRGGSIPGVDAPPAEPLEDSDGRDQLLDDPTTVDPSPAVSPELATGAPPQDEGRSDTVIEDEPALSDEAPASEEEAFEEIEDWEVDDPEAAVAARGAGEAGYEVRGRRREEVEAHKERPRVIQFLIAVWAELQRVQWPNRQALVTLTGVVLGFVLIAGGYLGLLDAIFSEVIQAIL
jgi:preprotein translocase SecE subunit